MASEETVFCTADIPEVPGYVWHADLNVVELSIYLDLDGRLAAITAFQRQWKSEHLRLVETA